MYACQGVFNKNNVEVNNTLLCNHEIDMSIFLVFLRHTNTEGEGPPGPKLFMYRNSFVYSYVLIHSRLCTPPPSWFEFLTHLNTILFTWLFSPKKM